MTPLVTEITVDLTPKFNLTTVKASQYDHNSRLIIANVQNNGEDYDLTGIDARVEGTRLDGTAFTSVCTTEGNQATFYLTREMTGSPGKHPAELVLTGTDGERLGSMNFTINVEAAAMDENSSVTPEDATVLQQYIDTMHEVTINNADGGTFAYEEV